METRVATECVSERLPPPWWREGRVSPSPSHTCPTCTDLMTQNAARAGRSAKAVPEGVHPLLQQTFTESEDRVLSKSPPSGCLRGLGETPVGSLLCGCGFTCQLGVEASHRRGP